VVSRNFAGVVTRFEGVAKIDDIRPFVDAWISEVGARRRGLRNRSSAAE
jgi:hypothetical protein